MPDPSRSPLEGLVAPSDPRVALPPFGSLPVVADLDELTTRVIAPNASPLTLDGTNTYVVGAPDQGVVVIVDPGPADEDHLARVEAVVAARGAQVALVLATHHHLDHSEALRGWAAHFGCLAGAPTRAVAGAAGLLVADGDALGPAGARLEAVATPGHSADHTAYRTAAGALLVGDHVLGRGTSVVAFPDGDLEQYLASLARVQRLGPDALLPGHGPALVEHAGPVLAYYAAHRAFREHQVLKVLETGPKTPGQLVEVIYAAVDRRLWDAAEASTRATLRKLEGQGLVDQRAGMARLTLDRASEGAGDAPNDRQRPGSLDAGRGA